MGKIINNIKSYFDLDKYKSLSKDSFISPAKSYRQLERSIVKQIFKTGETLDNASSLHKDIVSLALSKLGVKQGVSFSYFKSTKEVFGTTYGYFSSFRNAISFNENFSGIKNIGRAIETLSHEVMHKSQNERSFNAKYFNKDMNNFTVTDNPIYAKLCGFNNPMSFYHVNKEENEALKYGGRFAERILSKVFNRQRFSLFNRNSKFVKEQKEYVSLLKNYESKLIDLRENIFVNAMPNIYARSVNTFNSCYTLAKSLLEGKSLTKDQIAFAQHLDKSYEDANTNNPNNPRSALDGKALESMAIILGRCPVRENVEKFIDLTLSYNYPNLKSHGLEFLTENAVPLTKGDITRIVMCGSKGEYTDSLLGPYSLAKIDEKEIARSYLVSYGKEGSIEHFDELQRYISENNIRVNINFDKINSVVQSYTDKPILVNGQSFAGCSSLLNDAIDRLLCEGKIQPEQINETRVEISKNLVNIVNHFGYPQPTDRQYVRALERFMENPYSQQFRNSEKISEFSYVHMPELSEKLSQFIGAVREQGTQENPQATIYDHTNIYGQQVTDKLIEQKFEEYRESGKNFYSFVKEHELEEESEVVVQKSEEEQREVASKILSYYREKAGLKSAMKSTQLKEIQSKLERQVEVLQNEESSSANTQVVTANNPFENNLSSENDAVVEIASAISIKVQPEENNVEDNIADTSQTVGAENISNLETSSEGTAMVSDSTEALSVDIGMEQ